MSSSEEEMQEILNQVRFLNRYLDKTNDLEGCTETERKAICCILKESAKSLYDQAMELALKND